MFDEHLERWHLEPDGDPIITNSSRLLPVRRGDTPAMLKIAKIAEESRGGLLMVWWCGDGAARVLAHEGEALLLERSDDRGRLVELAKGAMMTRQVGSSAASLPGFTRRAATPRLSGYRCPDGSGHSKEPPRAS